MNIYLCIKVKLGLGERRRVKTGREVRAECCVLTAIGLTRAGSCAVHIYAQTIHRKTK
jgi:hypothetical protein